MVAEVVKAYLHHRRLPPLFFWRDRTGHEIDLLIEESGRLYPVEIKSSHTMSPELLDGLLWGTNLAGLPANTATLVYGGTDALIRTDMAVRPWFAIWRGGGPNAPPQILQFQCAGSGRPTRSPVPSALCPAQGFSAPDPARALRSASNSLSRNGRTRLSGVVVLATLLSWLMQFIPPFRKRIIHPWPALGTRIHHGGGLRGSAFVSSRQTKHLPSCLQSRIDLQQAWPEDSIIQYPFTPAQW